VEEGTDEEAEEESNEETEEMAKEEAKEEAGERAEVEAKVDACTKYIDLSSNPHYDLSTGMATTWASGPSPRSSLIF